MTDIDIQFCFSLEPSFEKERKTYFSNIDRVNHIRTHRRNSDKGELFGTWSAWLQRVLRGFLIWAKRTRAAGDWEAYRCSILADRAVVFRFRSIHESLNLETATLYTDSSKLFRTTAIHR